MLLHLLNQQGTDNDSYAGTSGGGVRTKLGRDLDTILRLISHSRTGVSSTSSGAFLFVLPPATMGCHANSHSSVLFQFAIVPLAVRACSPKRRTFANSSLDDLAPTRVVLAASGSHIVDIDLSPRFRF
ncbi:unnamed protein product [Nezara viridula]|uniref:Uncharacterized protein n=1 Tax=Nezara viridula TaxID=85310 RepID=A0A9P0HBM0_NEZVI|nr:unnamed protein product [Nezara viridula]